MSTPVKEVEEQIGFCVGGDPGKGLKISQANMSRIQNIFNDSQESHIDHKLDSLETQFAKKRPFTDSFSKPFIPPTKKAVHKTLVWSADIFSGLVPRNLSAPMKKPLNFSECLDLKTACVCCASEECECCLGKREMDRADFRRVLLDRFSSCDEAKFDVVY